MSDDRSDPMETPVAADPERRRADVRPYPWENLPEYDAGHVERTNRLARLLPRRGERSELLDDLSSELERLTGLGHDLYVRGLRAHDSPDDSPDLGDTFRTRCHLPPDPDSGIIAVEMQLVERWLRGLLEEPPRERRLGSVDERDFGVVTYLLLSALRTLKEAGAPPLVLPTEPPVPGELEDRLRDASGLVEVTVGVEVEGRSHVVRMFLSEGLLANMELFTDEFPRRRDRRSRLHSEPFADLRVEYPVVVGGGHLDRSTIESLEVGDCIVFDRKVSSSDGTSPERSATARLLYRPISRDRSLPGRLRRGDTRWNFELTDISPRYHTRSMASSTEDPDHEAEDGETSTELLETPELRLEVRVGTAEMTLRELGDLSPGQILELDRDVGERVDLLADGEPVGAGELVDVEGRLGVRIDRLET